MFVLLMKSLCMNLLNYISTSPSDDSFLNLAVMLLESWTSSISLYHGYCFFNPDCFLLF